MVGLGDASGAGQDAEEIPGQVFDAPMPVTTTISLQPPVHMPASASSAVKPSGEHFVAWLKYGIAARQLIINDAKALVHTVSGTAYLVSPGVFQRYAQEHPKVSLLARHAGQQDWQWVQKRFEKLQLHRKQPSGLNIWTCEVTGPRKVRRLHGYLLEDAGGLFHDVPPNNPYLVLSEVAPENRSA